MSRKLIAEFVDASFGANEYIASKHIDKAIEGHRRDHREARRQGTGARQRWRSA